MRPTDLLRLARWLADSPCHEELRPAASRAAVSRAYYASYHTAVEFLRALGCPLEVGGKGHSDVRVWLEAAGVHDLSYAASLLRNLHELRLLADYGLDGDEVESASAAAGAIAWAEEIVAVFEGCTAAPSLSAAIRANLQREIRRRRL